EILTIAGRQNNQGGMAGSPPAPAGPGRRPVVPNPLVIPQTGPVPMRPRHRLPPSSHEPPLALHQAPDATREFDPHPNTLLAPAQVAQVTATPETYQYRYGSSALFGSPDQIIGRMLERGMAQSLSTTPVLVLNIPGAQLLTIGCRDTIGGLDMRFSWP